MLATQKNLSLVRQPPVTAHVGIIMEALLAYGAGKPVSRLVEGHPHRLRSVLLRIHPEDLTLHGQLLLVCVQVLARVSKIQVLHELLTICVVLGAEAALMKDSWVDLADVLLEVAGLCEGGPAAVTGEAASLVDALVTFLVGDSGELLTTVVADVRLGACKRRQW